MQTIDVLRYGQRTIMGTIARYGTADWSRTALGTWTAMDLVGHLGAFEARFADTLAGFVGEPVTTGLMDAPSDTFNDDQAAVRAAWTIEAVLAELSDAHERVMTYAARIPEATWRQVGTIPWYGSESSLDDLVVYQQYGHKREHDPQLSAALEADH
ncbi:MAG: DinB family protein [Candidatus Limnocylindria bacterium]